MNKFTHSAIVCAGGISKRMGKRNKVLLPYNKTVILNHVIKELVESRVSQVIVVLGFESEKAKKVIQPFGERIKITRNDAFLTGQTSSIKKGLESLDVLSNTFMVCMADMPLLKSHHYDKLLDFYEEMSRDTEDLITRPIVQQHPGHPVIMNQCYRQQVFDCEDNNGCRSVVLNSKKSFRGYVTTDEAYIRDIDTPEVYEQLIGNNSIK